MSGKTIFFFAFFSFPNHSLGMNEIAQGGRKIQQIDSSRVAICV